MMLILIGYCLSYGLGTEDSITLQEGERKLAGNFVLELENVTMNSGPSEMACIPKCTAFIRLIENDDDVVIADQISKRIEGNQETWRCRPGRVSDTAFLLNPATHSSVGSPR